ncbi:MAG: NYN domain-containing protein [Chloroflexota bacterium]|nr:NYN domain-containing protein [Chloroflexota bacterium]
MTTENTQPEKSDVDMSVEEQSLAPETAATPSSPEIAAPPKGQADEGNTGHYSLQFQETKSEAAPDPVEPHMPAAHAAEPSHQEEVAGQEPGAGTPGHEFPAAEGTTAPPDAALPRVQESPIRPFTDFIEEFRQAEARHGSALPEAPYGTADVRTPSPLADPAQAASAIHPGAATESPLAGPVFEETTLPFPGMETGSSGIAGEAFIAEQAMTTSLASESAPAVPETSEPAAPASRPVSPLLRPASRVRLPRYSGRHRDAAATEKAAQRQAETPTVGAAPATPAASVVEADPASGESPRPARRYRFDRPAVTNGAASATPARVENEPAAAEALAKQPVTGTQAPDQAAAKQAAPAEGATVEVVEHDRRRRHGSDKQKEKEKEQQAVVVPPTSVVAVPVPSAAPAKPGIAEVVGVSPEDLPPLEYAEIQAATSRRRRRRRTTGPVAAPASPAVKAIVPEQVPGPIPAAPAAIVPVAVQRNVALPPPVSPGPSISGNAYNIVSGYTVNQMNQGNEASGPFMGPDPSPARGSVNTREARASRESHRATPSLYSVRTGESGLPPSSLNHLTNGVVQALQAQTDRMVAELRRANQAPTNVSVTFPPFPSNERVGVFVDVANLLYSARTLRMAVDFGKLLDFLRGNRRLIRAHAYCPTSPQPGDEQMFLQAVKGLGYRITTKNYKTFSSGAKKADLDLDLCMDVVRLVDGKSVDCIVLVSGDSDFMPMLDYCSDHGVRVEVAAFDEAMSATLRQSCDLFINLSMLEEIRA